MNHTMELPPRVDASLVQDVQNEESSNGMADELSGSNEVGMDVKAEIAMLLPVAKSIGLWTLVDAADRASAEESGYRSHPTLLAEVASASGRLAPIATVLALKPPWQLALPLVD